MIGFQNLMKFCCLVSLWRVTQGRQMPSMMGRKWREMSQSFGSVKILIHSWVWSDLCGSWSETHVGMSTTRVGHIRDPRESRQRPAQVPTTHDQVWPYPRWSWLETHADLARPNHGYAYPWQVSSQDPLGSPCDPIRGSLAWLWSFRQLHLVEGGGSLGVVDWFRSQNEEEMDAEQV